MVRADPAQRLPWCHSTQPPSGGWQPPLGAGRERVDGTGRCLLL